MTWPRFPLSRFLNKKRKTVDEGEGSDTLVKPAVHLQNDFFDVNMSVPQIRPCVGG